MKNDKLTIILIFIAFTAYVILDFKANKDFLIKMGELKGKIQILQKENDFLKSSVSCFPNAVE